MSSHYGFLRRRGEGAAAVSVSSGADDEELLQQQNKRDDDNHHKRKIFPKSPRRLHWQLLRFTGIGLLLSTLIIGSSLYFGPSNFILWGWLDLSPLLLLFVSRDRCQQRPPYTYYWRGVPSRTEQPSFSLIYYDCVFDLCNVRHEGGQGRLYPGTCTTTTGQRTSSSETTSTTSSLNVLLKTLKGNHIFVGAGPEARATEWMGQKNNDLQLIQSGLNFLVITNLSSYQSVKNAYGRLSDETDQRAFVLELLQQLLEQLKWLHRTHLHLDVYMGNVLVKPLVASSGGRWKFQLIDYSSAYSLDQTKQAIQYSFSKKFHIAKHPLAICLLRRIPIEAAEYCRQHASVVPTCPALLDTFPLAILALHLILPVSRKRGLHEGYTFGDVVTRYGEYKNLLTRLPAEHPMTDLIMQLMDDGEHLNSTLICGR
jgi:hypothetical protein